MVASVQHTTPSVLFQPSLGYGKNAPKLYYLIRKNMEEASVKATEEASLFQNRHMSVTFRLTLKSYNTNNEYDKMMHSIIAIPFRFYVSV